MGTIKQLEEKNNTYEIDLLVWSYHMDLVALSNVKGEVALHRLTWTRAWSLVPEKEESRVKAIAWRPDDKVLAIAYNLNCILLVNVENKDVLHRIDTENDVTCLKWVQEKPLNSLKHANKVYSEEFGKNYTQYTDCSSTFLSNAQTSTTYNAGDENTEDFFQHQSNLNVLIAGTNDGILHFRIFARFSGISIDLNKELDCKVDILDVHLSEHLNRALVTVKTPQGVKIVILNTGLFHTHAKELFCVALKHQQLYNLIDNVSHTISTIKESWESILLEMDIKLASFADKVPAGTLSTDFLDLLVFGNCTPDMQYFLLQDLTPKGLEKFGQTIEMCYANIQKLILMNLNKVGQNITYHLSELRGMARFANRYNLLGIDEDKVTAAISSNGSFLIKTGEMQQVSNNSLLYYKAFFRWLYIEIINLTYEQTPPELPKMTQMDLVYIGEFVQSFDNIKNDQASNKKVFVMERLGQYLLDKPLNFTADQEQNEWDCFLQKNECIAQHSAISKHCRDYSLVHQYKHLVASVDDVFKESKALISQQITVARCINCFSDPSVDVYTHNVINHQSGRLLYIFNIPERGFWLISYTIDEDIALSSYLSLNQRFSIRDLKFYNDNVVTMLLDDYINNTSALLQYPLHLLKDNLTSFDDCVVDGANIADFDDELLGQVKTIPMVASKFSVSVFRRVAVVLSDTCKKVILFEMEGEDDEDEDADMTNSTVRESDASMQELSD